MNGTPPDLSEVQRAISILASALTRGPDESEMTPEMVEAYNRVRRFVPGIESLSSIRANPALESAKLLGQRVAGNEIEINPSVTNPRELEGLLVHEWAHTKPAGSDETLSNALESLYLKQLFPDRIR